MAASLAMPASAGPPLTTASTGVGAEGSVAVRVVLGVDPDGRCPLVLEVGE
ncbi:hypothetical protein ACFWJT_05190 [Streptomyces sp. NPDC127069]|uniref:hypothetical protein n=1 Tax=Streptomyces sp. NPDC127069 TaxID=3347128 RepID=UPI003657A9A8